MPPGPYYGFVHLDANGNPHIDELGGTVTTQSAMVSSLDLKTAANTLAYTVPAGKKFLLFDVIVECLTSTAVIVAPIVSVGKTSGATDWTSGLTITGMVAGKVYLLASIGSLTGFTSFAAGETVYFNVTTGATATVLTANIRLVGMLV